jgi:hypothetical protein
MDPTEILGVAELLMPFTARHADPYRQSMAIRQAEHTMPTLVQHAPMVGTGVDVTLAHFVSDEFAFKSKEDGVVSEYNEAKQFAIVKYKSGATEVIDLSERQRKTNVGGFFITTHLKGKIKKGQTFKAGTILAQDESYFKDDQLGRAQYMSGCMCKVALAPLDATIEDSAVITESASKKMASWVTFSKDVALDAKTTVDKIVKKGQIIKAGEPFIVFEETFEGDDAASINKMLDKLGTKDTANLEAFGKTAPPSKYGGEIVDIQIHYNVELSEMSSSLRKIVKAFIADEEAKAKAMHGAGKDQILSAPHVDKTPETKIRGQEFTGVMFVFYVKTMSEALVGEKISFEKAVKSIVSTVIPQELAPYAESSPNDPIECIITPMSVIARMTPDVLMSMYTNKVLLELKSQVKAIVKR